MSNRSRKKRIARGQILASAADKNDKVMELTAPIDIAAAGQTDDGTAKPRTFQIDAYNGGAIRLNGFFHPVVIDLAGMEFDQNIPVLIDHEQQFDAVFGQTTTITNDGAKLVASGEVIDQGERAKQVLNLAAAGLQLKASIGAMAETMRFVEAGKSVKANGQSFKGPVLVAKKSRLREISMVVIGADNDAKAMVAKATNKQPNEGEHDMKFNEWLEAKGWDPEQLTDGQRETLQAAFDAENEVEAPKNKKVEASASAGVPGVSQIIASAKAEQARVDQINTLVANAIKDSPYHIDEIGQIGEAAIEAGSKPIDVELELLRLARTRNRPNNVRGGKDELKLDAGVIEASLARAAGMRRAEDHYDADTLQKSEDCWRHGLTIGEMLCNAAAINGNVSGKSIRSDYRDILRAAYGGAALMQAASGPSLVDVSTILSNVQNKFIVDQFNAVESAWRNIAAVRPVSDYKQVTTTNLAETAEFEALGPGGEIKHGSLSETSYTNQADIVAKMLSLTQKDIVNDDMNAFSTIGRKLGRGGALKLNKDFWTEFLDNSTFFTTARGNKAEGATGALDIDALTAAVLLAQDLTDPSGAPLGIDFRYLLVPNALDITANNLMTGTERRDTTASTEIVTRNPHVGRFEVVRSAYLGSSAITNSSSTGWYLIADPADLPVMEVVFLNGQQTPTVDGAEADFSQLGIQMRGYFSYGVSKQEYRAGVYSDGTN